MTPSAPPWDPLGHALSLELRRTFHPLGLSLDLETNASDVIAAAQEAWGSRRLEFDLQPVRLQVIVGSAGPASAPPRFRGRGDWIAAVADPDNLAVGDAADAAAVCWVTAATVADSRRLRYFYLEALVYQLLSLRYLTPIHAACVTSAGRGLLLCGPSGAGKSALAYACCRQGCELAADDAAYLLRQQGLTALGRGGPLRLKPGARTLFPEIADLAPQRDPDGGEVWECWPPTATRCEIQAAVWLDRGASGPTVEPLDPAWLIGRLRAELPLCARPTWESQSASLERLAQAGVWRLRYQDPAGAAALLKSLLAA